MTHYHIADLYVDIDAHYDLMRRRLVKYELANPPTIDFTINVTPEKIKAFQAKQPHLSLPEAEYILISSVFNRHLLHYQRFYLHASAICFHGVGILFSADSGVGKSTHTKLWQHVYKDEVTIINDDKPTLRYDQHHFTVYGTPFSGNSDENENICVPLHAIVFIKRSHQNSMRRLSIKEAIPMIMRQTTRYNQSIELMDALMSLLDELLKQIPIYELSCTIDPSAAYIAKEALFPKE